MEEGIIQDQAPEGTLEAPSAAAIRTLEILLGDQERSGDLDSDRVDSLMDKRSLDAPERVWVYRQLGMESRVSAVENGLDDPESEDGDTGREAGSVDHVRFCSGRRKKYRC